MEKKKLVKKFYLKQFKKLQKNSKKQLKQIIKLAIIFSTPIFKLHKIENKKQKKRNRKVREIPAFISKPIPRISLAIKFILASLEKKKSNQFYKKFNKEIILNSATRRNCN